jgi:hypothetical protein
VPLFSPRVAQPGICTGSENLEESVAQPEIVVAAGKRFSRLPLEVSYKDLESWQDGDGYSDSE